MTSPKLFVTCFRHGAVDNYGRPVPAPMTPSLGEIKLDICHENQVSPPFPHYTSFIMVRATGNCCLAFSDPLNPNNPDPVADQDFHFMSKGETRFYGVMAGSKIAVIEGTNR